MKTREEMIAWQMMYCQHYETRGLPKMCRAGVLYESVGKIVAVIPGNEKRDDARPCVNGHLMADAATRCPKWLRATEEQGIKFYEEWEESRRRMALVGPAIVAWRKKPPKGKQEVIECPACKGKLHLSQAASNGHVHGRCETAGCVSWME